MSCADHKTPTAKIAEYTSRTPPAQASSSQRLIPRPGYSHSRDATHQALVMSRWRTTV